MKTILSLVAAVAVSFAAAPNQAEARPRAVAVATWEVQVKYWFFDTEHYYWSTYYKSTNERAARWRYELLKKAKQQGTLNKVAPSSYWRYIAVDVRLVKKTKNLPRFQPGIKQPLQVKPIRPPLRKKAVKRIPIRRRGNPRR